MKFNISLKTFLTFVWILQVSSEIVNNDGDFVPITQQPLIYYPQPRIVGGNNANETQFPHQVSIRVVGQHICGGSLISKNYVLTAGHCTGSETIKFPAALMTVRVGSINLKAGGVIRGVSLVIPHSGYRNYDNDIALLKLSKPVEFTDSIKPISLATQDPTVGSAVVTSGWGLLRNGGDAPQILQYNTLKAIGRTECQRRMGSVPTSVICLGHTVGNGVCNGDSGGPAVLNNQLVGVTNFVVGGCGSNAPDGYASVAYFNKWIKDNSDL